MELKIYKTLKQAVDYDKNGIIISRDIIKKNGCAVKDFIIFENYKQLEKHIKKNDNLNLYEVFLEHKPLNYVQDFDFVDKKSIDNHKELIEKATKETIKHLIKHLKKRKIDLQEDKIKYYILKSKEDPNNPEVVKKSYHIIYRIENIAFKDNLAVKEIHQSISKKLNIDGLDDSIYKKNQQFRLINNSKINKDNKLELIYPEQVESWKETFGSFVDMNNENLILLENIKTHKKKEIKKFEQVKKNEKNVDLFLEEIKQLLECLNQDWAIKYEKWDKLGIILYSLFKTNKEEGLKIWKEFCKTKSKKHYNEKEIETYWKVNYLTINTDWININNLKNYAKIDNPEKYKEILNQFFYNKNKLLDGNHSDTCKLFFQRFEKNFMKTEDFWLFFNEETGIFLKETKHLTGIHNCFEILINELESSLFDLPPPPYEDEDNEEEEEEEDPETKFQRMLNDKKNKLIEKLKNNQFRKNCIDFLGNMYFKRNLEINVNKKLFCFDNGVYDLEKMCFRKGKYEEFIVDTCGYDYKYDSSENAKKLLEPIIPNVNVRNHLLQVISSHLVDEHKREEFNIFHNPYGNNGKTIFGKELEYVFGNYFYSLSCSVLYFNDKENGEEASPALTKMKGKRFILIPEFNNKKMLDTGKIKLLCGGDTITSRDLFKSLQSFKINACFFVVGNKPAYFTDVGPPLKRRLKVYNSETEFVNDATIEKQGFLKPNQRKEETITDEYLKEIRHSFFQLLLENHIEIQKGINNCPEDIIEFTKNYLRQVDNIEKLVSKNFVYEKGHILKIKDIKNRFNYDTFWIKEFNLNKIKFEEFLEKLEKILNIEKINRRKIEQKDYRNFYLDYRLLEDYENDFEDE
jgi:phage/plasmid-associated DNA primase